MKRKYSNPYCRVIDLIGEGMIALSYDVSPDHADDDFVELGNKKDYEENIWGDEGSIWK